MVREVLAHLEPARGGIFVDCTVGLGGHARALLEGGASRLLGFDRDPAALSLAREALAGWGERVELIHADYRDLGRVLDERGVAMVDGILADLGVSS
ncbi:MAG: 16S rRNA (cytosine(1402)-N(4))-methyltransferase, partial [Acidobacteria bacterium]